MLFGVREICNVVLKAKATQQIGNKIFYKNEPVIYFDTLKTSTLEGASTTVYATGGRGNSRLVAWEGERTVTFTMEDALISPEGFMILTGAGLIDGDGVRSIKVHTTETIDIVDNYEKAAGVLDKRVKVSDDGLTIVLSEKPYIGEDDTPDGQDYMYVMFVKDGEIIKEPFIPSHLAGEIVQVGQGTAAEGAQVDKSYYQITVSEFQRAGANGVYYTAVDIPVAGEYDSILVDYYVEHKDNKTHQIEITPDKFGGNYYLEADTLFRTREGVDMPAEFIIPNCKVQSNFTFTMAASGDPSTFTFTMDAFPDYTRFNHTKKVLAAIQVLESNTGADLIRSQTNHEKEHEKYFEF